VRSSLLVVSSLLVACATSEAGDAGVHDPVADTEDYNAASNAAEDAVCACTWSRPSYLSEASCRRAREGLPQIETCRLAGVTNPAGGAEVDAYLRCQTTAYRALVACTTPLACMQPAYGDCIETAVAELGTCHATAPTFNALFDDCIATMIVGSGSDSCDDTATASMNVGNDVFHGTTLLAGDHRMGSCATMTGSPDVALRWRAFNAGTYRIDTEGSEFDTVLYVREACDLAAHELACNDDLAADHSDFHSVVDVTLVAGQVIEIVVDGTINWAAGPYHVNIRLL
jgi:hypothetical protein